MAINRVEEFLGNISGLTDESAIKQLCLAELDYLSNELTVSSKKRAITRYRNEVRSLDANHLALKYLKLDADESTAIKKAYREQVYKDHTNLRPIDADSLVIKAESLIQSDSYLNIAVGLMLLTGRRATEVLKTAKFTKVSDYSVEFSGQLKTKGSDNAQTLPYVIPVLTDSDSVVTALNKLRSLKDFSELTNDEVHSKTNKSLSEVVKRHFSKLVQQVKVKDFRSAYATICFDVYCSNSVSQNAYFAKILGHSEQDLNTGLSYIDFYLLD